ncbi:uncharacterized protein LOC142474739 isoform X1 [Ascaphus truei]|uniref:uncharacterized protein LOC142474739 isoform X1 n=1 Tax=Ascaphus truei TaxID=8439 RepID=UPI003F5AC3BD
MSGKNCRAQPDFPTEAETSRKRKRGKSQKSEGAKRWGGTLKTKIGGKENYKTVECHQEVSSASDGEDQKETAPVHKRAGITGTENRSPANTGENPQRGRGSSKGRKKNSTPSRSAAKVSSASDGEDQEDSQLLLDSPGIQGSRDNRQQNGGETPKRGRGRPKGSKNRYQSWAAINKGVVITGADLGAQTPKRGSGRRKGSKNRIPSLKFTGSESGMGVHGDDGAASSDVDKDDFNKEDDLPLTVSDAGWEQKNVNLLREESVAPERTEK